MDKKTQKPIKGIRIRTINFIMVLTSCILYIILISATFRVSDRYQDVHNAMDTYIACEHSDALLTSGSAYLTEHVRLYVVTMEPQYMEDYFTEMHVARRRETALEQLSNYPNSKDAHSFLEKALLSSNDLVADELYAMKLVSVSQDMKDSEMPEEVQKVTLKQHDLNLSPEEMVATAQEMVFGNAYQNAKDLIISNIEYFMDNVRSITRQKMEDSARSLERTMMQQQILISILFVENILTFIAIIVLIIKPLQIYVKCIKEEKMMEIKGAYEFKYLALTYNDIYEINAANESMLRYQAEHDPLTGIMNRGAFDHMRRLFKTRIAPLGLLIIDVDKFKLVNDRYGHEVGDEVLKKVAKLLEDGFRATDYPARIGGDEFAVILTSVTPEQRTVIESKISSINSRLMNPVDDMPRVSLSVGGAFSEAGFTDDLYQKADLALYDVKKHGRCGCEFYQE